MTHLKIAVIGAGSSYTPEIIEGFCQKRDSLPVDEIVLMDINPERLHVMAAFCQRYLNHLGYSIPLQVTLDRRQAIEGASFILTQIRVGGNSQRILDEKIPLRYGVIGQETTGPGGMLKALRTIPPMLELAHDVEEINPQAWIINYTNPTGIITEAVSRYSRAQIVGLCAGAYFPRNAVVKALGVAPGSVDYDYFGLNHLNFAYNLRVEGRLLSGEEFNRVAQVANGGAVSPDLLRVLRLIPSPYLQYFYHRSKKVTEAHKREMTRGEEVLKLEEETFRAYADPSQSSKPAALAKRGGGGYSEIALEVMEAIYHNGQKKIIVNVPQCGAVSGMPEEAVLEIPCMVNDRGFFPLQITGIPSSIWGLIEAVKNYEHLTVEAAVDGSRDKALLALLAHPLVGDYDIAEPMLAEMLQANLKFLPQFIKG